MKPVVAVAVVALGVVMVADVRLPSITLSYVHESAERPLALISPDSLPPVRLECFRPLGTVIDSARATSDSLANARGGMGTRVRIPLGPRA